MEYSFKMAGTQLGRHSHLRPRELSPFLSVTQQVLDVRFDPRNASFCPSHCPLPSCEAEACSPGASKCHTVSPTQQRAALELMPEAGSPTILEWYL